jgi:hypothetical protein
MHFDLYNEVTKSYRCPSSEELHEIRAQFPEATDISFQHPILIIASPTPPSSTPLTVGGCPTVFVPKTSDYNQCPGHPGNPRIKDPLKVKFKDNNHWEVLELVYRFLEEYRPTIVSTTFASVIVELAEDIAIEKLPGMLGGWVAFYTVGGDKLENMQNGRARLLQPTDNIQDDTDYTSAGLTPGIRIAGRVDSGTAGCLLEKNGVRRLTVPTHCFDETEINVYHPRYGNNGIAKIVERWKDIDISLCQLASNINFTNTSYFEAPAPRELVRSDTVDGQWGWCWVDGYTTGAIPFLKTGLAFVLAGNRDAKYHELRHYRAYNLVAWGPAVGDVARGLCGAPVVMDADEDGMDGGRVLGFFRFARGETILVQVVDELINAGWQISND